MSVSSQDQDLTSTTSEKEDSTADYPPPTFQPMDKVIARDRDGVMYHAVVRRAIYGRGQAEQIQLGLYTLEEADELLKTQTQEAPPGWYYFVHFNKWKPNFDSWLRECDVYHVNDNTTAYATRVSEVHKQLRKEMSRVVKGKKSFQTIDGNKFLQEWRKRLMAVDVEFGICNPRFADPTATANTKRQEPKMKKKEQKEKEILVAKKITEEELKLRKSSLTRMNESSASKLSLSFGLKQALVDQWEIITQCGMVTDLPSSVTVRQVLDGYLWSKGVDPQLCELLKYASSRANKKKVKDPVDPSAAEMESPTDKGNTPVETHAKEEIVGEITTSETEKDEGDIDANQPDTAASEASPAPAQANEGEGISEDTQGWIDMANGIAQYFDEALPCRLLYLEEFPQLKVIQRSEELAEKRYSEIYGAEYLLRMITRLPELLEEELTQEECRSLFAKLNDFLRYLQKNQSVLLAAHHRKPNSEERVEAMRLEVRQLKKRQREASAQAEEPNKKAKESNNSVSSSVPATAVGIEALESITEVVV